MPRDALPPLVDSRSTCFCSGAVRVPLSSPPPVLPPLQGLADQQAPDAWLPGLRKHFRKRAKEGLCVESRSALASPLFPLCCSAQALGATCCLLWVLLGGCASFLLGLEAVMAAGVGLKGLPGAAFPTKGKQGSVSRNEGPMGTERMCGSRWTEESVYSKGCGSAEPCRGMEVGGEDVCTCLIWAGEYEPGTWGAQEPGLSLIFLSLIGLFRAVGFSSKNAPVSPGLLPLGLAWMSPLWRFRPLWLPSFLPPKSHGLWESQGQEPHTDKKCFHSWGR